VAQKNLPRLVAAFAAAAAKRPALRLTLVGHGPLQAETEQAIAAHGMKDRVQFVRDFNGRNVIAGFNCLLCSSDYESFGLVILEALAAGVPVVTTPVGIGPEAVLSGKTGLVTSDFNAESLAAGVIELVDCNAAQRAQMATAAKAQAQNFNIERMSRETRGLYTELLKQKTGIK
jgi:glycosyltransferase involved in cell wall biosynthesis